MALAPETLAPFAFNLDPHLRRGGERRGPFCISLEPPPGGGGSLSRTRESAPLLLPPPRRAVRLFLFSREESALFFFTYVPTRSLMRVRGCVFFAFGDKLDGKIYENVYDARLGLLGTGELRGLWIWMRFAGCIFLGKKYGRSCCEVIILSDSNGECHFENDTSS